MLHWGNLSIFLDKTGYYVVREHFFAMLVIVILNSLLYFIQSTDIRV